MLLESLSRLVDPLTKVIYVRASELQVGLPISMLLQITLDLMGVILEQWIYLNIIGPERYVFLLS